MIRSILESPVTENQPGNTEIVVNSNLDEAKIKDLQRRVAELEKLFRGFTATFDIELINNELIRIDTNCKEKADKADLNDLKLLYNDLLKQILSLKDLISGLTTDNKINEELLWLRNKVEYLLSTIKIKFNEDEREINSKPIYFNNETSGKYLEISIFNEFKRQTDKEFDNVHSLIKEIKLQIESILNSIKSDLKENDNKTLNEFIILKIEELKLGSQKKFADKNETAKNLKYLDGQIRHIIDVYFKKIEKGDNWMLAKKPLGGNSCASCEAYIGNLHDNSQYIPWKNYPIRDGNEKLYRIGNGFSKMLQMINLDNTNQHRNIQTSSEFYRSSDKNKNKFFQKNEVSLPAVINTIETLDDVEVIDITKTDDKGPKVVKIYKKSKEKKLE